MFLTFFTLCRFIFFLFFLSTSQQSFDGLVLITASRGKSSGRSFLAKAHIHELAYGGRDLVREKTIKMTEVSAKDKNLPLGQRPRLLQKDQRVAVSIL